MLYLQLQTIRTLTVLTHCDDFSSIVEPTRPLPALRGTVVAARTFSNCWLSGMLLRVASSLSTLARLSEQDRKFDEGVISG